MTAQIQTGIPGNPDPWWQDSALRAIDHLAASGVEFTAADLDDLGVPQPDHPCRWGAVFSAAKSEGVIHRIGYRSSRRPGRNRGVCAVWIGSEYVA